MIRQFDRRLARTLLAIGAYRIVQPRDDLFRCARVRPRRGARWIWNWMKGRQAPDDAHHAPCCPANRWSDAELVVQPCNCGAHKQETRT